MTRIRLAYIHQFKDRHGRVRHYYRRPGYPRAPLPGLPGSAEFMAAYQAALEGKALPIGGDKVKPGSFDALAVAYYASAEFKHLATTTQGVYRKIIERLRAAHGGNPVAEMQASHVRKIVAAKADTPAAANRVLSILKLMMRLAVEDGWRRDNPAANVRRVRIQTDGLHTWSEAEIDTFNAKWSLGTREHLALALLLYTGQRRGDVVRMGRQHIRNGAIDVRQGKTGARLAIPVHPALRAALDACPSDHLTFLVTQLGKPFAPAGFSNWFVERARSAGLPKGCSPHGLRKAAARRLAEAGCTAHQIAAVTGHATLKEVERYTRAADQEIMAAVAIARIGTRRPTEA